MQQCQEGRQLSRQSVVVGEDHLHPQLLGQLQRFRSGYAVIDGHQQANALVRQSLNHGAVKSIAIVLTAGDRRQGARPQPLQHPHQQGSAGHPIGVVVAADSYRFSGFAAADQPLHRHGEVGKVAAGRGGRRRIQQGFNRSCRAVTAPVQQHRQLQGQQLGQLSPEGAEQCLRIWQGRG